MATVKKKTKVKPKPKIYGPASEAQRLILTAPEDVLLVGGGRLVPSP